MTSISQYSTVLTSYIPDMNIGSGSVCSRYDNMVVDTPPSMYTELADGVSVLMSMYNSVHAHKECIA